MDALALTAPKAPLCKGSCHANSVTEGLMRRMLRIRRNPLRVRYFFYTIPPSRLTQTHLPLHKGGFGAAKPDSRKRKVFVVTA